jgi:hypothetical protein
MDALRIENEGTGMNLNAKEKMQLREAIRRACVKFGYNYHIDDDGHVMCKGWRYKEKPS